jgi:hypothetical protein
LLLSAGVLAGLTGISLLRMQGPEELQAAGAQRTVRARGPAALPAAVPEPGSLETVQAPLATTPASLPSTPAPPPATPPAASGSGVDGNRATPPVDGNGEPSSAAGSSAQAPSAPAGEVDDSGSLTTMEPLTVVELAPGKSVEIEARTRLSLRLKKEARAASAPEHVKASGAELTKAGSEQDTTQRAGASKAKASKAGASKTAAGKSRAAKGGSGKAGSSKTERAPEARAPSELMNPWPSPVIGPAKE